MHENKIPRADFTRANVLLQELVKCTDGASSTSNLLRYRQEKCQSLYEEMCQLGPMVRTGAIDGRMLAAIGKLDTVVGGLEAVLSTFDSNIETLTRTRKLVATSLEQGNLMVSSMLEMANSQRGSTTQEAPAAPSAGRPPLAPPDPPPPFPLPASGFEYPPSAPSSNEIPIEVRKGPGGDPELTFKVNGRPYHMLLAHCRGAKQILLPDRGVLVRVCGWFEVYPGKPAKLEVARDRVILASRADEAVVGELRMVRFKYQGDEYKVDVEAIEENLEIILPDLEGTLLSTGGWTESKNPKPENLKVVATLGKVVVANKG